MPNSIWTGKFIFRHYRSGNWCPYQSHFHDIADADTEKSESISLPGDVRALLQDGEEIEVTVRKTGRKLKTRWELIEPHTYAVTDNPKSAGCPDCQAAFPLDDINRRRNP